nr:hypothetical protein [Tanacetum cinerariifolium]
MRDTVAQTRVLNLDKIKTTQRNEIDSLKGRVKKLKKRIRSRTHKLKRLYKVGLSARVESSRYEESLGEDASKQERRIDVIDSDKDITLVNDADKHMFDVDDLGGEEVFVAEQNENVVEEVVNDAQNKGKGIMIEEPMKPKKKDQIRLDEEADKKLQAKFDEEERLAKQSWWKAKKIELEQEITKKQKVEDDKEKAELKQLMETIPDEEVAINAIPLAFNEDLEDLYKLVKARYGSTRPVENIDYMLWSDMKIMFKPHVENKVWKLEKGYKVLEWKLYDSYGVHSLMMHSMQIYMLVEKKYPLTLPTLSMMLEKKLQIDYESEMAY